MKDTNQIRLTKRNLSRIMEIVEKFPEVIQFTIHEKSCGIGSVINLELPKVMVKDIECNIMIEIEGAESW